MRRFFQGPRVVLRALERQDAESLSRLRDHPEVARYQTWSRFTEDDARSLIEQMLCLQPDVPGQWYQFGVGLRQGSSLIGDCAMLCPASDPNQAEIGFTIGRDYWGQGYGSEAVSALVSWLIEERRKRRVFAVVDGRNYAAHRLLASVGFQRDEPSKFGHYQMLAYLAGKLRAASSCHARFPPSAAYVST